jgi:hypothetical protein
MTNQHRATPEQWEAIERYTGSRESYSCILELRARIETLGAAQQPPQDKLDRLIALDRDDPANSLVAPPMPVLGDAEGLAEVFWGRYDQPEPVAPSNKEVVELVARLRDWHSVPLLSERERAAALLERLASDNAGLAAAADSLYADNMSLLDSHHD